MNDLNALKNYIKFLIIILLWLVSIPSVEACRFWVIVGEKLDKEHSFYQLVDAPKSLKSLGSQYQDGWSVAFYDNSQPIVLRGMDSPLEDPKYVEAVNNITKAANYAVYAHIRKASSGCVEGVNNPHPFIREAVGKKWMFGHNGGMKKQILIDLLGDEYLKYNLPTVCTDHPPESWIDSELYFIYLLKYITQNNINVLDALKNAIQDLYAVIPEDSRYLNFFLSNGEQTWIFRKGTSLYYYVNEKEKYIEISSTVPDSNEVSWNEFPEDVIAQINIKEGIKFLSVLQE